ncbi:hypothetical protein PTTG_04298 [Puccinia triticina 1-1 BBBD Race 1]|uniref:SH3 domain-containing protein n=1 Tax=Puccinia triticina (isolate 1-1 / race 1 (BBBD)) TaxID=630390 RepID=A0A180GNZ0_PUCT1|nr:hypothetical protein PTTG_04298 [Puccinia triticina 1-1 BBBD Race 1]
MSKTYPYQARALMRFKAQDGQFVLGSNQLVTVTGQTDDEGDWLSVTDRDGGSGSVPAGFLIEIQPGDPLCSAPADSDGSVNLPTPPPASKPHQLASIASHDPSSSQPSTAQSQAPPPPAAKPNALRDRIAMFNKPAPAASSPAPNTGPKPPVARKPMNIPPPAPPIEAAQDSPSSTPVPADDECARSTEPAGMSAADAEESVKAGGSLKDRIRLLQQQQQQQTLASEQPATPPKPKREWKRPPSAPTDEPSIIAPLLPSAPQEISNAGENITDPDNEAVPTSTEMDPGEEAVEEEDEIARRRRIAERMAKLGGARMGFGFPGPAAAPPKPSPPQHFSEESSQVPEELPAEEFSALPPERIVMPAIPKRAAPPKRKAPALPNTPSAADAPLEVQPEPLAITEPDLLPLSEEPPAITNPDLLPFSDEPVPSESYVQSAEIANNDTGAPPPAVHPEKSGSSDSYAAPSPPQRAAPSPKIPDPTGGPEDSHPPPISPDRPQVPSTPQVTSEGAHSDRSATTSPQSPPIPDAYSSPKSSSIPHVG